MEFQKIIHPVSVFLKERFKDYFLPVNIELEKKGNLVSHADLLETLKKRDGEEFSKAMNRHFAPYYQFLDKEESKKNEVA
jgi:GntR family transcriptional regulator, transcriptional repressor for pyruvate dehydrogenase complex